MGRFHLNGNMRKASAFLGDHIHENVMHENVVVIFPQKNLT